MVNILSATASPGCNSEYAARSWDNSRSLLATRFAAFLCLDTGVNLSFPVDALDWTDEGCWPPADDWWCFGDRTGLAGHLYPPAAAPLCLAPTPPPPPAEDAGVPSEFTPNSMRLAVRVRCAPNTSGGSLATSCAVDSVLRSGLATGEPAGAPSPGLPLVDSPARSSVTTLGAALATSTTGRPREARVGAGAP